MKEKANEYAFKLLKNLQKNHSKTKNLNYCKLQIQQYLENEDLTLDQKRLIFKYRTRMENYGENYRGARGPVICPLCRLHPDSQEMSLKCPIILAEFNPKVEIEEVYQDTINLVLAKFSEWSKPFKNLNIF